MDRIKEIEERNTVRRKGIENSNHPGALKDGLLEPVVDVEYLLAENKRLRDGLNHIADHHDADPEYILQKAEEYLREEGNHG